MAPVWCLILFGVVAVRAADPAPMHKTWRSRAMVICREELQKQGLPLPDAAEEPASTCRTFADSVELSVRDFVDAAHTHTKGQVSPQKLFSVTSQDHFRRAGETSLRLAAAHAVKANYKERVMHHFVSEQLMNWFLGCASERLSLASKTVDPKTFREDKLKIVSGEKESATIRMPRAAGGDGSHEHFVSSNDPDALDAKLHGGASGEFAATTAGRVKTRKSKSGKGKGKRKQSKTAAAASGAGAGAGAASSAAGSAASSNGKPTPLNRRRHSKSGIDR